MHRKIFGGLLVVGLLIPFISARDLPNPVPDVVVGFSLTLLSPLPAPTALAFGPGDSDGPDLYATTLTGSVQRISLLWTAQGPVATGVSTYASGFSQPLGLVFVGSNLFVSDSHPNSDTGRIDGRVTLVLPTGSKVVVIDGLPNGRHNTNHLRVGPGGYLYITNGNPNDNGVEGGAPDVFPYSGAILAVDPALVSQSPAILKWKDSQGNLIPPESIASAPENADFASKVHVLAYGFRNIFGVAFDSQGNAYTAMNGADSPSSQDALYRVPAGTWGTNFGFPFCYPDGPTATVHPTVSPNPLFPGYDCSSIPPALALLGWHVCATGLDLPTPGPWAFTGEFSSSVYIGECGPFFPEPQNRGVSTHDTGHKVVRVSLDSQGKPLEVQDFITGLALPTDVLFGPDGALYVADAGGIWRVANLFGPSAKVTVEAAGFSFLPPTLVIPSGTTVVWDGALLPHTVTSSSSLSGALSGSYGGSSPFDMNLPQGSKVQRTFLVPGEYPYFCSIHYPLGMVGEIVVV